MNNYDYASRLKRFINFTIDGVIVITIYVFLFIKFAPILLKSGMFDWMEEGKTYDLTFTIIPIYFFYYLILEGFFKTTIGKIITKTRLIKLNGKRINFGNVVTRTICRFIPLEQLSYLTKKPVGLHDSISNTRLIQS